MGLSTMGSEEKLSVLLPGIITDPLGTLVTLQKLFDVSVLTQGYEREKFKLRDHNRLCITTNNKGLLTLVIKGGYMSFYKKENHIPPDKEISAKDINTLLMEFCKAIEQSLYCKIRTKEERSSDNFNEYEYKFEVINGEIVRTYLGVEHHW